MEEKKRKGFEREVIVGILIPHKDQTLFKARVEF